MTKVDLITGFLGSGKTTFIRKYARYLMDKGLHIGIIENDFGAINVDMMLLSDLEGDNCELEMVSGGCDADCHFRRFKTKLIAMGMLGLDRVIVEPSGIYDVNEFFDALNDEPLDRWYEAGSVITIVDGRSDFDFSPEAKYMFASQLSSSGCVLISKLEGKDEALRHSITGKINKILSESGCEKSFENEVVAVPFDELSENDFVAISKSGYKNYFVPKRFDDAAREYSAQYYMNLSLGQEAILSKAVTLFQNEAYGKIMRVKGFIKDEENIWLEVNITKGEKTIRPIPEGQDVIIVIGEKINREKVDILFL